MTTYPDVAEAGAPPLAHFVRFGLQLDRDPGPNFSSVFFKYATDPEALGAAPPLLHHVANKSAKVVPERVLNAAMQVLLQGRPDLARSLAEKYLPSHLAPTLHALEVNQAWLLDDMKGWVRALNRYLASHQLAPISLRPAKQLIGQLHCPAVEPVNDGPLITVIMPVWNAADTLEVAVASILDQSWRNLELIAVDDASTDKSWQILKDYAAQDPRLKPQRNAVNVGPYVAKNLGLNAARGAFITGHDADDWAHPDRLTRHMQIINARPNPLPVTMPYGLRMQPDGLFHHTRTAGKATSFDGWMQSTPIGTLFEADFLRNQLGYWDSVRFGADTEILWRARQVLGQGPLEVPLMSMICLDASHSLSNHPVHGTRAEGGGLSWSRRDYLSSVKDWLLDYGPDRSAYLDFPQTKLRFPIPAEMRVSQADIKANLDAI